MAVSLKLGSLGITLNLEAKDFHSGIKAVRRSLGSLSKVGAVVGGSIAVGLGYAIKSFADLEQAVTNAAAVTKGDFKQNFEAFKAAAMDAAAGTLFSAKESGQALEYLARAGLDAGQAVAALKPVLQFATAGNMDLAAATDIATDIMTAFRLNVSQLPALLDQLTYTAATSNTNVRMLGEAMKYVAPVAASMGQSTADINAMLGKLASAGIKASMAGTSLKTMFVRMVKPMKTTKRSMKALGTTLFDAKGEFRSMVDVIADFEKAQANMSTEQFAEHLARLVGSEALPAVNALLAVGSKSLSNYSKEIQNSTGKTKEMAELMANTVHGQFKIFKGNVETLAARVGSMLLPVIKALNTWLIGLVNSILKNDRSFNEFRLTLADVVGAGAEMVKVFGFIAKIGIYVGGVIGEVVRGLRLMGTAVEATAITAAAAYMMIDDPKNADKHIKNMRHQLDMLQGKAESIAKQDPWGAATKGAGLLDAQIKTVVASLKGAQTEILKTDRKSVKALAALQVLATRQKPKPKNQGAPRGSSGGNQGKGSSELIGKDQTSAILALAQRLGQSVKEGIKEGISKGANYAQDSTDNKRKVENQQRRTAHAKAMADLARRRGQIVDMMGGIATDIADMVLGDGAFSRAVGGFLSSVQNVQDPLDALTMMGRSWAQALVGTVMEHEKTKQHFKVLNQAIDDLGLPDVLGGFLGALEPGIGAIISVTQALKPLGEIFGGGGELQEFISGGFLKGIKVFLGAVLKLGEVVGYAAYGIALVGQGITSAVAYVVNKIADIAEKIGIYLDTSFVDNLRDSTRDAANNIRATLDTIEAAQQSLKDVTIASGQAIYDETKLRAELNERMKEGLRNDPSGFKVNWERFNATQRGGMGDASVDLNTRRQGLTVNGDVTINTQAASGEEIYQELAMLNYRRSGNTMASMQTVVASKQGAYKVWG